MTWWVVPLAAAVGYVGYRIGRASPSAPAPSDAADAGDGSRGNAPGGPSALPAPAPAPRERVLALAREFDDVFDIVAHPDDLATVPGYQQAVALLAGESFSLDDLYGYLVGDNSALACAAAEALGRREELVGSEGVLVARLDGISIYARTFLLRAIRRSDDPELPIDVLVATNGSWSSAMGLDLLRGYLRDKLDADYVATAEVARRWSALDENQVGWLRTVLEPIDGDAAAAVRRLLADDAAGGVDLATLKAFANVLGPSDCGDEPLPCDTQQQAMRELRLALRREPARSLLLVGARGVGKATIYRQLARKLLQDGWTVFVAGATQLMAGQSYVGQIEQRVLDLVRAAGRRPRVLWIATDLAEFLTAGRTMQSPTGLLDLLMPHLVAGELRVLAPVEPAAVELLLRQAPLLRTAMRTVRVEEAGSDETLQLAEAWLARHPVAGQPLCDRQILNELFQRSQQHVVDLVRPGSVLTMLAMLKEQSGDRAAALDDVITLVSRMTGLPPVVLDERDGLDLDSVRKAFAARVLGQPEAVDCLVERIAMLKAGLCDPRRPVGVFLFTGPTGTGKTELCRVLSSYLFGSEERLLRLDMSEFQQADSIARITGDGDDTARGRPALVHAVREQPFSVVLLDEIEKAHPLVFDLFLQVFDEGRLTDRSGRVADFRHAIVILTSNLGVKNLEGAGLGFGSEGPDLQRALEEVFRREFLNRIDRVVVFRSLDRATLLDVLHKELDLVLQRRGLKSKPWAVEWDESALQFLLSQGYSAELGARPLRRAIERHVLAPLAAAIVTDRTPKGDQFLFVRSDGRGVQVEFVDPDADQPQAVAVAPVDSGLRELAAEAKGAAGEVAAIAVELQGLRQRVDAHGWLVRKDRVYADMGEADFWTSERRHAVLGVAECMSRIEEALAAAVDRSESLSRHGEVSAEAVRRLAVRAMLLGRAVDAVENEQPQDAYLQIAPVHDPNGDADRTRTFAAELLAMYRGWSKLRGMQWRKLDADVFAVSGFAALQVLLSETGLHVFDTQAGNQAARGDERPSRVRVVVVPQPPDPATGDRELELARGVLQPALSATPTIVRRYRGGSSPEVRDRVRGWRTGRFDRVMAGEFDVIG